MNGELVKKWMKSHGVKPEELATKLGISYPTVRSIMAGKKPYRTTVTVLANLMGITAEELLGKSNKVTET